MEDIDSNQFNVNLVNFKGPLGLAITHLFLNDCFLKFSYTSKIILLELAIKE